MRTFSVLVVANFKSFIRDRAALFWTIAFPMVFILLFGLIFSGGGAGTSPVGVVDLDHSPASEAIAPTSAPSAAPPATAAPSGAPGRLAGFTLADVFEIHRYTTQDEAVSAMEQGRVRAVIVIPQGFGAAVAAARSGGSSGQTLPVRLFVDPSNQQQSATIQGVVGSLIGAYNIAATGRPPILSLDPQPVQPQDIGPVAYLVPSILAMALMQLGLFSAIPIVEQRQNLILKRIAATPIRRRTFIAAAVVTRLFVALVQAVVILVVAGVLFKITLAGNPLLFVGVVMLGALTFIALGYVVASFAPTEDAASQMTSILQFPLMFLSGIFFAIDALPDVLRGVAALIPLTYLGDALRQVMVNGTPFVPLGVGLAVLAGWLAVCFAISARFFRWQ